MKEYVFSLRFNANIGFKAESYEEAEDMAWKFHERFSVVDDGGNIADDYDREEPDFIESNDVKED